jgi:hypothetical protein
MIRSFPKTVEYIARKKDGPFTVSKWSNNGIITRDWIIDCCDSPVYIAPLSGNSKQRRQQRRKLLKDLNR